jgi:hypothetical protein
LKQIHHAAQKAFRSMPASVHLHTLPFLVLYLCLAAGAAASQEPVAIVFSESGLESLKFNGLEFLENGRPEFERATLTDSHGKNVPVSFKHRTAISLATRSVTQSYDWGEARITYIPKPDRLGIAVTITNSSAATLGMFHLSLCSLRLPEKPRQYDGSTPLLAHNTGEATVIGLTTSRATIVLVNEDVQKPLVSGFPWATDRPRSRVFPLLVNTGRIAQMYPDSLPSIDRPVPSGGTITLRFSLRFAPPGADPLDVAADVIGRFATAFPFRLAWSDRRPIGALFFARAAAGWPDNPRGWFNDAGIDVTRPAGIRNFHRHLLAYADRSIVILRRMNAQGVIAWDIEGDEFPHAITYIGDPRLAEELAPEVRGVIDSFFQKFREAGFRTGFTIRPQRLVRTAERVDQIEVADPAQQLIDKIAYARKRWGATLFYIDSNGDPNLPLDAGAMERVAAANPDVLLIPESENLRYYATTAPYNQLNMGFHRTPTRVKRTYPGAFNVIAVNDERDVNANIAALVESVRAGNILLFRGWMDEAVNNTLLREVLSRARER